MSVTERASTILAQSPAGTIVNFVPYNRARSDFRVRRDVVLAEEGVKPKKDFSETATRWFGLLGVVAAAAALVLVPVSIDREAVISNPGVAYYRPELRVLLATSVALLVAAAGMLVFDKRPLRFPVLIPVLALLGVSALSTLFSDNPMHSLYGDRGEGLLSVAAGVLLFYALAQGLTSRTRLRLFLAAATAAAALVSVFGIAENYGFELISGWSNPPFADLGRSSATIGNSLTLVGYLTLMMGTATALWMGATTRLGRLVWLVALALIGACWIYAEARGAFLGVGLALPLVLLAVRRRMETLRPLVIPVVVLAASMVVAVAVSGALGYSTLSVRVSAVLLAYLALVGVFAWLLERGRTGLALLLPLVVMACAVAILAAAPGSLTLSKLGVNREATGGDGDVSMQTRLYTWRDTIPMILDRPLLGHGPDNYREPFLPYISQDLETLIEDGKGEARGLDRSHNHALQLAATTGLLGLAAYLWVLGSFFRNAYKRGWWLLTALSGAVLAYVIQLQTAFPSVATDVAFWGVLGASVALMRFRDGESTESLEGDDPPSYGSSRGGRVELLAGLVVVGTLVSLAVPTFLQQREKTIGLERAELTLNVFQATNAYRSTGRSDGTYPKDGTYTRTTPILNARGRPAFRPSGNVVITTETTPEGEFIITARSTTLAGTFSSSYDSARSGSSAPPSRND